MVEKWNRNGGTIEHLIVEQSCPNSRTSDGGTVKERLWNSRSSDAATVEHLMVKQ